MIIQKFGGTSVGSPDRMRELTAIIDSDTENKIVVLSAVAGTTNKLVNIAASWQNNGAESKSLLLALYEEYKCFVEDLLPQAPHHESGLEIVLHSIELIEDLLNSPYSLTNEKIILAQGELMATRLYRTYLESIGRRVILLDALSFMKTNHLGEPNIMATREALIPQLKNQNCSLFLTQGYICRNFDGEIDNLQRGGSDYTATILGAVLYAEEVQIWTDIDGMHNNDPRVVEGTQAVRHISYREAAELAYFGAKILHPSCVLPAETESVPIRLKYTFDASAAGTLISTKSSGQTVTAIAAKDGVSAIKIRSGRMINAYGFLRRVFEVFEKYETPIDMITTSEVSVSLTIDSDIHLVEIINELSEFGEISFEKDQSIICIVGDKLAQQIGAKSQILSAFSDIPVRMISYGGSLNNISILVDTSYKNMALRSLQEVLFSEVKEVV